MKHVAVIILLIVEGSLAARSLNLKAIRQISRKVESIVTACENLSFVTCDNITVLPRLDLCAIGQSVVIVDHYKEMIPRHLLYRAARCQQ